MKTIKWGNFKALRADVAKEMLPLTVTVDGEPMFVVGNIDNIIVLDDLHIRVKNTLKAQEKRARMGMPKATPTVM